MNQILAVRRPVEALGEKDDRDRDLVAFDLATAAVSALLDEAELTPKPALVDRRGSGAHHDLDLTRVRRSARALEDGFAAMARAAAGARAVLAAGGTASLAGLRRLHRLDDQLMALWASPGGSTDLLSVTLFLDRVDGGCVRVQAA